MLVFEYRFTVQAPIAAVAAFHRDSRALKRLTPPPLFVQFHHVEPLAEGSVSEFTLWLGPLPLRWRAVHSEVHPLRGFTDRQAQGPLRRWRHTHRFEPLGEQATQVVEHIEYQHADGRAGLFTRLAFSPLALRALFWYRSRVTRRALEQ